MSTADMTDPEAIAVRQNLIDGSDTYPPEIVWLAAQVQELRSKYRRSTDSSSVLVRIRFASGQAELGRSVLLLAEESYAPTTDPEVFYINDVLWWILEDLDIRFQRLT